MGEPPCGAEPRIELGPALQQADATPKNIMDPQHWFWQTTVFSLKDDADDDYIDVERPDICICGSCSSAEDQQNNSKKCCLMSPCLSTDSEGNNWFIYGFFNISYGIFLVFHLLAMMYDKKIQQDPDLDP